MPTLQMYWRILRPFSFPASVFPSLVGSLAALTLHQGEEGFAFSPLHAGLSLLGCIAIHATSNLLNDYYDWRSGLDRMDNSGQSNPLVQGTLSLAQMRKLIVQIAAIAIAIGLYFLAVCGPAIGWIIAIGAVSAWAYTAPPFALKYRGLGEVQVMLSFGVLMTLGSYIVQAWQVMNLASELSVLLLALPQSLLIAAILHANNHRDRRGDRAAGAQTLSLLLGSPHRSIVFAHSLVWGAYLLHGMVVFATQGNHYPIPAWTLLAWVSMPWAWRALRSLKGSDEPTSPHFATVVVQHARLQLFYGSLMVLGLAIAAIEGMVS